MGWLRAACRTIALALWLALCLAPHLAAKALTGRSGWPRRFLKGVGWILGARVAVEGAPLRPGTLALANHTSWLDIVLLSGATGTAFVSKAEIGAVPLIGWLARQNHTVFVERGARGAALAQVEAVRAALAGSSPVTICPEGTTNDGTALLPFKPALIAAAGPCVRPVAIDYGAPAPDIAWKDEPAMENVRRILKRPSPMPVTIRLLPPLDPALDRKAMASAAQAAIAKAISHPSRAAPKPL